MKRIRYLLLSVAFLALQAGIAFSQAGDDLSLEEILQRIETLSLDSPAEALAWAGEQGVLPAGADMDERAIRLKAALAPAFALRTGYRSARLQLLEVLGPAGESRDSDQLMPLVRVSLAELAFRHGFFHQGLRELTEGCRWVTEDTAPAVKRRLFHLATHFFVATGHPYQAMQIARRLRGLEADGMTKDYALLTEAYASAWLVKTPLTGESLDAFARQVNHSTEGPVLARFWAVKAFLAWREGKAAKALNFIAEARTRDKGGKVGPLAGFLQLVEALVLYESGEVSDVETSERLDAARASFSAAGYPGLYPLLLANLMRIERLVPSGRNGIPFLQALASYADRDYATIQSAYGFLARAHLARLEGEMQIAQRLFETSQRQNAALLGSMDRLLTEWNEVSVRNLALTSPRGLHPDYLTILVLLLIVLILVLVLTLRTQRQVNQRLRESVEKARIAEEAADHANRLKSQFVSNISHEIKTPMSGLVGMASILDELVTDPVQRRYLQTIKVCSQNLLVLMDDLLDLGRIEGGRLEIERAPFRLQTTLDYCRQMVEAEAQAKGLRLVFQCAEGVPENLWGDATRLGQVLVNLLKNAIKYTDQGTVELSVSFEQTVGHSGILILTIRDSGIGIAPERLQTVFEPFNQSARDKTSNREGTGLGLAISKRLVDLMSGTMSVQSEVGKGSVFVVELPFTTVPA